MILTKDELSMLEGRQGKALAFAMDMLVKVGQAAGATRMVEIEAAYVNTCFAPIATHADLLEWLASEGAQVAVKTFTNVGASDPSYPELRPDQDGRAAAVATLKLQDLHRKIGCRLTMTCAPYQLPDTPELGAQLACSESNAVSYFNSVVGARSEKYGDYLDISAALTGRVPLIGLHTDSGRRAGVAYSVPKLPEQLAREDLILQLIGHAVGRKAGKCVPALIGLPSDVPLSHLRSICAAAAASGGVAMFHAVGLTPEADTLEAATQGQLVAQEAVTIKDLNNARAELSRFDRGRVDCVTLGTPHASLAEVKDLVDALGERKIKDDTAFFLQMNNHVRQAAIEKGWLETLNASGVQIVTDTCLYWRPHAAGVQGRVMTNSAKFAYYAPGEIDVVCRLGSLRECVESAITGIVWEDPHLSFL